MREYTNKPEPSEELLVVRESLAENGRNPEPDLTVHPSRRERQILGVLYRRGSATAAKIRCELPEPPTYSTVRALLRTLERKGYVKHEERGIRFRYTLTAEGNDSRTISESIFISVRPYTASSRE